MEYEYKTKKFCGTPGMYELYDDLELILNEYAERGWEYINSVTPSQHNSVMLVFRRPKQESSTDSQINKIFKKQNPNI